jgi:phage terminase large subunit GpA-like protein
LNSILGPIYKSVKKDKLNLRDFANTKIIIPEGPLIDKKFDTTYPQFFVDELYKKFEDESYRRYAICAPAQSGKTLSVSIIPLLYYLFEKNETCIFGIPKIELFYSLWHTKILPIINNSFKSYLIPNTRGSRGGKFESLTFSNKIMLRILSAGGNARSKSSFTCKNIFLSEVDGYDESTTDESDVCSLIETRANAFLDSKKIFLESTPTTIDGRIWQELLNGTYSKIYNQCPYCNKYVLFDRENLIVNLESENEIIASENAYVECPECKHHLNELDRNKSLRNYKIIDTKKSNTFSLRYNAYHNSFFTIKSLAEKEYVTNKRKDKSNADRDILQSIWALPYEKKEAEIEIDNLIKLISTEYPKNTINSENHNLLIPAIDIGKHLIHFVVSAFDSELTSIKIVDYGTLETCASEIGEEKGIKNCMAELVQKFQTGYFNTSTNKTINPIYAVVDVGYNTSLIKSLANKYGMISYKGFGDSLSKPKKYFSPKYQNNMMIKSDDFHLEIQQDKTKLFSVNADVSKSLLLNYIETKQFEIFNASSTEHQRYLKHLNAEQIIVDNKTGRDKWIKIRSQNHYLDCTSMCLATARLVKLYTEIQNQNVNTVKII